MPTKKTVDFTASIKGTISDDKLQQFVQVAINKFNEMYSNGGACGGGGNGGSGGTVINSNDMHTDYHASPSQSSTQPPVASMLSESAAAFERMSAGLQRPTDVSGEGVNDKPTRRNDP